MRPRVPRKIRRFPPGRPASTRGNSRSFPGSKVSPATITPPIRHHFQSGDGYLHSPADPDTQIIHAGEEQNHADREQLSEANFERAAMRPNGQMDGVDDTLQSLGKNPPNK